MTARTGWEFNYKASDVLRGATDKLNHHKARTEWWAKKKAETVARIRSEGLEINESVADLHSNSYNRGASVQVRNDLMRDLQECGEKGREHREKSDDYAAWVQVLESQGEAHFPLHHDDWMFFFGK